MHSFSSAILILYLSSFYVPSVFSGMELSQMVLNFHLFSIFLSHKTLSSIAIHSFNSLLVFILYLPSFYAPSVISGMELRSQLMDLNFLLLSPFASRKTVQSTSVHSFDGLVSILYLPSFYAPFVISGMEMRLQLMGLNLLLSPISLLVKHFSQYQSLPSIV